MGLPNAISLFFLILAGEVLKNEKNRLLAGEVSSTVKIAFPRRARIKKKVTPMQHGSAEIDFCDTSSARTSMPQNMTI